MIKSARACVSSNTRPRTGWVSCRFIPRKVGWTPLINSRSPSIDTLRKPICRVIISPADRTWVSYRRGRSALHGSTGPASKRRHRGPISEGLPQAEFGDLDLDREGAVAGDHLRIDRSDPVGRVPGAEPEIVDRARRPAEQCDVAEDARQPPLILIFEVAHRRPLVHPDQDHVGAGPDQIGDVELLDQPAAFADPDLLAVQPDAIDRLDAVEPQQHPFALPVRKVEGAAMITGGVLVRDVRRIDRERVLHVGVDRLSVRPTGWQHPVLGQRDRVPARCRRSPDPPARRPVRWPPETSGTATPR